MKNELGRTLMETLATLAIMGVLSVTGILGFQYLIKKHQANTIIEEAKMQSVLLAATALSQGLPEASTLENLSHPFTYQKESDVSYSLTLTGLDKGLCQILKNETKLPWAETVLINQGATCQEKNTISFYININMTPEVTNEERVIFCEQDTDCGECGSCGGQGVCVFYDSDCTDPDKPYCHRGMCRACEAGQFKSTDGKCYDCMAGGKIMTLKDECSEVCPNRDYIEVDSSASGGCMLPCPAGQMRASDGECYPCNYPRYLYSNSKVCLKYCPNKIYQGAICRVKQGDCEEGYVLQDAHDGSCHRCDSLSAIIHNRTVENNCLTDCGHLREVKTFTGTDGSSWTSCALKVCPKEAPIRGSDGSCGQCGVRVAYVISADECEKCANSFALVDASHRTYCLACPALPTAYDVRNNRRGCEHCGFKWDEANSKCT
ncbi:MAG: Tfp pilus assembly protein FimT/FimU [Alphaproteobacteria bacterium]